MLTFAIAIRRGRKVGSATEELTHKLNVMYSNIYIMFFMPVRMYIILVSG